MKISLIAMDMDGTLLQSDQTISEKTTKKLIELQQKGIKIVLVSGRNYNRLKRYAEQLQLEKYGGYLIEVNGMAINDLQKKQREVLERLSIQQARELFALLQPYEVETQYIMDDGLYVRRPGFEILLRPLITFSPLGPYFKTTVIVFLTSPSTL